MPSISPLAPIWPDLTCMGYKRLERSHLPLPQVRSPHPSRQKGFGASCIKRWRTEARKLRNLRTGSMIPGRKYSGYCWTLSTIYLLFIQNTWTENIEAIVELEQKCSICEDEKHVLQAAASSSGRRRSSVAQSKEFTKLVKDLQEDYAKKVFSLFFTSSRRFFLSFFPCPFYCAFWGLRREDRGGDAGQLERKEADEGGQERNFEGEEGRHGELVEHGERRYRQTKLKSK